MTAGPEIFVRTLCRHFQDCEPAGFAWLGSTYDQRMRDDLCRLFPKICHDANTIGDPARLAVNEACKDADVLVCRGFGRLPEVTGDLKIPVVEVSHTSGEWERHCRKMRNAYKGASHWAAVSEAAATAFPVEIRDQVTVIPNGVEVDSVTPRRGREWQREQWIIGMDRNVALYYGRLHKIKRVHLLVKAIEHLPEEWLGVIIGDGPELRKLRGMIDGKRLNGRIRLLEAVRHVGDILAAADVFVLPSECEGHPLTLNEAWLAGVPAVCCEFGFCQEMLRNHGGMMYYLPVEHSPEDLARMIQAAGHDKSWEIPQRLAHRIAWNHYTASAMTYRWETYLQGICNERT